MKLLTVRLDDDLHAAVMAKAAAKSTNVSALVRKSLQGWVGDKIGAGEVADLEGPAGAVRGSGSLEGTAPSEPPPPEPKSGPSDKEIACGCDHPKRALVIDNAQLGLAHCGACGTRRNSKGWIE